MGEFEKSWFVTVCGRKAATVLAISVILVTVTYTVSLIALLIDHYFVQFLPPEDRLGLSRVEWTVLGSLVFAILNAILRLYLEPKRLDRALDIRRKAEPGDPLPNDESLSQQDAAELNRALDMLRRRAKRWHSRAAVANQVDIFWSPLITQNACTYGATSDNVRVVFSADLLVSALATITAGTALAGLTDSDRAGILAHELGHVESGDFKAAVVIGGLMRLLNFCYFPILLLYRLIAALATILLFIPFIGGLLYFIAMALIGCSFLPILFLFRGSQMTDRLQGQLREYVADAFAMKLMGSADEILTALMALANFQIGVERIIEEEKKEPESRIRQIGRQVMKPSRWDRYTTAVVIGHAEQPKGSISAIRTFFKNIDATHPPLISRWERLAKLGFQLEIDRREGKM